MLDHIIGFIRDKKALKACALTHRSWTLVSQQRLHAARVYHPSFNYNKEFAHWYSKPTIAALVRYMILVRPPSPTDDVTTWTVFSRFTRVTKLTIALMDWIYCSAADRDWLSVAFGQVTELTLVCGAWRHGEDLVFFLSAFHKVTRLRLDECRLLPEMELDFERFPCQTIETIPGSKLRSLAVIGILGGPNQLNPLRLIGPWLSHLPKVVEEGLHFEWLSGTGFATFPHYVRTMGPVLAQLDVSLVGDNYSCSNFGLETCTQLQNFIASRLCQPQGFPINNNGDNNNGDNHWVSRMLSQVRSSYVESVRFNLEPRSLADLRTLNFKLIDIILSQARFAKTTLTLSLATSTQRYRDWQGSQEGPIHDLDMDDFTSFIQNEMENLWAQGRIVLVAA
ncbi:uncharacterized protein PHACADRAFT_210742 [Phanerochaete carnosa HHB-10118-sp]|uniref:F-box domain-containing protein n=1 Tax=Phanerochaete carnosa (strain HHB-10118-sp) TaxID=650164 RepID=K5USS8_PHACS|nr:uncharacterized protein PHACADRAFT_210742 [Phanerochaete carnosa HHB-10118-sp]EKM52986.1 hypothetical protein PHACADRAFT_210742 [Phanerochaete carnosa HHB-10118-sp]